MPKIDTRRRKQPSIGDLRSKAIVCTWVETPDADISVVVTRPGVFQCMARVLPIRGSAVLDYQTAWGDKAPTHEITIRVPLDVHVALNHWIYVETPMSKTWYRIRLIEDLGGANRFLVLYCMMDTVEDKRSDPATQQSPPNFITPVAPPDVI